MRKTTLNAFPLSPVFTMLYSVFSCSEGLYLIWLMCVTNTKKYFFLKCKRIFQIQHFTTIKRYSISAEKCAKKSLNNSGGTRLQTLAATHLKFY